MLFYYHHFTAQKKKIETEKLKDLSITFNLRQPLKKKF